MYQAKYAMFEPVSSVIAVKGLEEPKKSPKYTKFRWFTVEPSPLSYDSLFFYPYIFQCIDICHDIKTELQLNI